MMGLLVRVLRPNREKTNRSKATVEEGVSEMKCDCIRKLSVSREKHRLQLFGCGRSHVACWEGRSSANAVGGKELLYVLEFFQCLKSRFSVWIHLEAISLYPPAQRGCSPSYDGGRGGEKAAIRGCFFYAQPAVSSGGVV